MDGRVVVITGANGGLGAAVTQRFLASGANVVGVSLKISDSDFPNPNFTGISAELGDSASVAKLIASIIERYGKIDALAHLVGGFRGGASVADTDDETFDTMMSMNARAFFLVARAVIPHMRRAGQGRIVAVGSRAAIEPGPNVGAYSASKAALVSLVQTIARENRDMGITANAVLPGTMDTPGNRAAMPKADTSKWVAPAQVAELIFWLSSDAAAQVTGSAIPVFGRDI